MCLCVECLVMGWGFTNYSGNRSNSDFLHYATVSTMSFKECRDFYGEINGIIGIYEEMFCAIGLEDNANTHYGDSGGPLVCDGQLVGITSFGEPVEGAPASTPTSTISFILSMRIQSLMSHILII